MPNSITAVESTPISRNLSAPSLPRGSPLRNPAAMKPVAETISSDRKMATTLARSTNRSTSRTSSAVPARTSSGRMAWKSMGTVASPLREQSGEQAGDRRVGHPQHQPWHDAEGDGQHDQRRPGGHLDRGHVAQRPAAP